MDMLKDASLLRIFIGESDRYEGQALFEWLVLKAREAELAGATVLRGIMGFGANSRIVSTKFLRLSQDLPIVVEIVDTHDRLERYLETIDPAVQDGLITLEKADVRLVRGGKTAH